MDLTERLVMEVAERSDRSTSAYLLRVLLLRPFASQMTKITICDQEGSLRLKAPFTVREKCHIEERQVESIWLYDITPKKSSGSTAIPSRKPKRVYYIAGGSWQTPPNDAHWKFLSGLVRRLDQPATVTLISCPLAPRSPADITYPLLAKLYRALSADGAFQKENVYFGGDSSGANIVLSMVMHRLGKGDVAAPAGLILISPSVDLSHRHSGLAEAEKRDPLESLKMIKETAKAWAADLQETDPRLSPALGDIKVLADRNVKVYGIIAGDDVLSVEAEEFVEHCKELGVEGRFLVWRGQVHDFPIMAPYKIPESVKALEWITVAVNEGSKGTKEARAKFEELESKSVKGHAKAQP